MTRELKVGDTVYTPCTTFNTGETWLEEMKVKEIGMDFIVLTHVATLRKQGEELDRQEVAHVDERSDRKLRDYYSRPFAEIMKEYRDQNDWFVSRILSDTEKYG